MKDKLKKIIGIFFVFSFMFTSFNINILNVKAAGEHQFSLKAYDWNPEANEWEGSGTDEEILNNSNISPGQVFRISMYYVPGETTEISMQVGVQYDPTLVEPLYADGDIYIETDMSTTYQGGIWPAAGTTPAGKRKTNWVITYNDDKKNNLIKFLIEDSLNDKPLETEGVLASMYFKAKETLPTGSVINFSYDNKYTMLNENRPKVTSGINLNVKGEESSATTLSDLSVKSGDTTYTLNPTFNPNSGSTKEYEAIVPNQVDTVTIDAIATSPKATVASGTGEISLNVGKNDDNIIVQAEDGTQDTYVVHVYRLSSDATLKSLNLSNNIDIGNFSSTKTTYTALVPYSTKNTTVTATKNDSNATIKSGTGSWDLVNYGSTKNTKNVIVEAENCNTRYSSVPNNTCTTKTYSIDITRTAPSSNANLSYLTIDGVSVPNFSGTKYEYTLDDVSNSTTSINVNALVEDTGKATIDSILGEKKLNVGDNKITVTVKAEDETTKEYVINVRRLSNDSKLSSLTVSSNPMGQLSPTFSSTLYDYYTYTAPSTVETVDVSAVVNDQENAKIISGTGTYNINSTNSVNIIVQAEDGSTSTYIVKLVRTRSSNANLSSLTIDGYNLNETFSPDVTSYTANVSGDITTVNISAVVEDTGKATITSGTGIVNLNVGNNNVTVKVQAEDGTEKDYTIVINRAKKTVSSLTDLKVDGVTISEFNESKLEYDLGEVDNSKTSINITATAKDIDSTITGIGEISLKTGENKLYVTVTAQDGKSKTAYVINITRKRSDNAYLSDIKIDNVSLSDFSKTKYSYEVEVPNNATTLNLAVTTESSEATYTISNNADFVTTEVNPVTITVTSESGSVKIYTINVTRKKSDNNYLKSLSLSNGVLNPVFNKLTNAYTVDVSRDVTTETITATLEDAAASYEVSGPNTLEIGENTYEVTVTSESGIENVYTIVVNRNKSNNNYLSDIKIDDQTIAGFNKTKESYNIDVDSTKQSVVISATTDEVHATTKGTGTFNLVTGENTFNIVVTAENGEEKTYTIVINKEKSDNSKLSSLSIEQTTITPEFSPSTLNYSANVDYSVTNIDIEATASDSNATIEGIGNKELNTGVNIFEIVVTSENNTQTTYKITVTRAKNNNANLNNITLSGGYELSPSFDSSISSYEVNVPNETESIEITAFKQDPNAVSVTGTGTISLKTGENNINIIVTAEDGKTTKLYKIKINRAKSSDATLKDLTISEGTLTPAFNSSIASYKVVVPNEIESITVNPTVNSSTTNFIVSGNDNLNVGTNTCTVTVTAEDGTIKVYTIEIERQPSSNNFLRSLSVKDLENNEYIDQFIKTKTTYDINVENNVDEVTILGVLEDSSSSITGNGNKKLDIGNNTFEIQVTSAAGIKRTYTLNIFREANSNNYLSSLSVEGYTLSPDFNKNTENYTLSVDSLVDEINVSATAEVDSSIVSGTGKISLETGENIISITVQAQDGSIKTYVINVTKAASNNNYLSNLTISEGKLTPDFNRETLEYSVHVGNEVKTMDVDATAEHEAATVSGTGLKSLGVGTHKIDIVVKAENNEERTYSINVTRDASSNKDLSDLKIDGTTIENFNKDVLEYEYNVENSVDSVTILGVVEDETASVTGDGPISLVTGENDIEITVTAEDGTFKVYKIKIVRAKSDNNYLSNLTVSEGQISPEFSKENLEYNVTIPYEVTSLNINTKTDVSTAVVKIEKNGNFVVGNNEVIINVTAENGDVRTYKINVTRQPEAKNFLTGMTITDNNGVNYEIKPSFNKLTYSYEVGLPTTVTDVNINVTKQVSDLKVTGDGQVPITSLPQTQQIIVSDDAGLERTYTVKFVKGLSANTYLNSLTVSSGVLKPSFDKDTLEYSVSLPYGTNNVTLNAEKQEQSQIITGLGKINLSTGKNVARVTVTSENGNIRTYSITFNVEKLNENNKLSSLSVDKGTLTPAFNPDTRLYSVDLDESETDISISATGSNAITGTGTHNLDSGSNVFEVISTDSTGNENVYRIVVNRGEIVSSYLKYLAIDNYKINETFNKENYNYTLTLNNLVNKLDVIAIAEDKNATVLITGNDNLNYGNNNINIVVTDEQSNSKTYTVNVTIGKNKIESNIHKVEENYIQTITEKETVDQVKSEMLNPNEQLKIYNQSGDEVSNSTIVGTGYKIKLVVNDVVYDEKTLIIKGDLNCDGEIGVSDIIKLRLHILETSQLDTIGLLAADVNNDNDISVADIIKMRNHILGNINMFEKVGE